MTLAEARKDAKTLKAEIALGSDPKTPEAEPEKVLTLTEFMEQHYLPFAKLRKRTWAKDEELFRLRLKGAFGHLPLDGISRQQIQTFHSRLKEEGLAAASCNHYLKLLKRMLNLAVEWELLEKNPASRIPLFFEDNKVEHYMDDEQLQRLLQVLRSNSHRSVCLIALFLLSTGARLNEALRATWGQIDRQNSLWRIPASHSKSKRVRSVPLNDSALHVLDQLETEGSYDNLFINRKTKKPYVNVHKVWDQIRKEAGLPHLRLHDLRHQYASFLVNAGRTMYEVQQILGHSDPSVTQRYAHLSTRALQEASASASVLFWTGRRGEGLLGRC
jgi:integrase